MNMNAQEEAGNRAVTHGNTCVFCTLLAGVLRIFKNF